MKFMSLFIALVFGSSAWASEKVYSKSIQELVCNSVTSKWTEAYYKSAACLKGDFTFYKDAVKKTIDGEEVSTQIFVRVEFEGLTFDVTLNAELAINEKGNLERTGWNVASSELIGMTDIAIIQKSFSHNENVKAISYEELPKKVAKAMDNYDMLGERSFYDDSDDWEDGEQEYFAILNDAGDVVGYIFTDSWSSEKVDVKAFYEVKFDKNGKFVDSTSESFNYHE